MEAGRAPRRPSQPVLAAGAGREWPERTMPPLLLRTLCRSSGANERMTAHLVATALQPREDFGGPKAPLSPPQTAGGPLLPSAYRPQPPAPAAEGSRQRAGALVWAAWDGQAGGAPPTASSTALNPGWHLHSSLCQQTTQLKPPHRPLTASCRAAGIP